jgi:hypothetical protein
MSHRDSATRQIRQMSRGKIVYKVKKSLAGLAFCSLAVYGATTWAWPWYVVLPVFGIGSHIFSEEWTRAAVSWAVGVVKDLLSAVKNGKS